jgi:predicted ABC-type ATPase
MSHPSKLDFISKAKEKGFKTYLYFVSTASPDIHVERVQTRVQEGGHDVPEDKIRKRYTRSLDLLLDALKLVDRAFVFDNSRAETILLAEKDDGKLKIFEKTVPQWFDTYVIKKIT